jgi:hypothetical protein
VLAEPSVLAAPSAPYAVAALAAPSVRAAPSALVAASALAAASALEGASALRGQAALDGPAALAAPEPLAGPSASADLAALAAPERARSAPQDPARPAPALEQARSAPREADLAAAEPPSPPDSGELSGLRLLLDQLDALLRDPTLALALRTFAAKLSDGVRRFAAAGVEAVKRLTRLRFPRKALLALLALLLPLVLLALLDSGGDDRAATGRAAAPAAGAASLPGVAMPALRAAQERPKPVRVALVLDRTYAPAQLRRELRTLGTWLGDHHAAGTRVTLIDARSARASASLRPSELAAARASRATPSTTSAIRSALGRRQARRLLVTVGSAAPTVGRASTLSITPRRGAAGSAPARRGRRSRAAIDDRRPDALAATVARAIMSVSGQRERR